MTLKKQSQLLHLLNLNHWVYVLLIFCVLKWEVFIEHFHFKKNYDDDDLKEK